MASSPLVTRLARGEAVIGTFVHFVVACGFWFASLMVPRGP